MRGSDHWSAYCASSGAPAVSRGRSASTDSTLLLAFKAATPAASEPAGNVSAYIESTGVASPGVPPAATISARWSASETPSANETMYGADGPEAAVVVVAAVVNAGAVVVEASVVVAASLVVAASVVVGAFVVVAASVVVAAPVVAASVV